MLYVVNVEACIHQENYGIFFYEPAAKQKIELFEAKWTFESLTDVFSQIAAHINRREFEDNDYQVIVCVRKHKRASRHQMNAQLIWHDTTLYAKTLTARALEQSGMTSVLTSSYTRKIKIVFQSEQEYFGSAQQISSWEEEQEGLRSFLGSLQAACEAIQNDQSDHEDMSGEKIHMSWWTALDCHQCLLRSGRILFFRRLMLQCLTQRGNLHRHGFKEGFFL